jgi:tetratricopeptide (TPR) repeat protein
MKFSFVSLFTITLLLLASCAPKTRPERPRTPPEYRTPPTESPEGEMTPERSASEALIEEGLSIFNQGLYDQAADLFQQAVTVDPSNGAGYYYLAIVKLRTGEYGEAEGLLEKAELLLSHNPLWTERLEELRQEFGERQPPKPPLQPL